jgi:hypothetical protein
MTTMHLASTSHGYWDSLAMLNESDLEPNKIFPPEMQRNNTDNVLSRDVSRIIQHAESVLASTDDLFFDLDLEPFPVNICSKGDDIPKSIIPTPSSFGVATSLNWLKQTDHGTWLNFTKEVPIASARLEDTLDTFINSISPPDEEENINDSYDWIATDDHEDEDLYSSLSRPLKRRKQTDVEGMIALHTSSAPCVSPPLSPSSSSSLSEKSASNASSDEVRFRGYQADQWMERFEDLRSFKAEFGNCLVPHSYPPNQQLAQWVKRQRYQYKLKSENRHSTLTVERQQELEDLGFVWDSHKAAWYERLEALKQYRAKHGNCMVPTNFAEDKPLAVWVKCQRRQLKLFRSGRQSTMTEERFVELDQLGFEWNPRNL